MDRLSNLPKHIIDDILSKLSEEDVARFSSLSKAFNDTCSTCPILRFSQHKYVYGSGKDSLGEIMPGQDLERKRNSFFDHVERTLTRFYNHCLPIREFKLHTQCSDAQSTSPRIDHWLELVVKGGRLQVLDLWLYDDKHPPEHPFYCLPATILHANSLIKLSLKHVKIDHALVNNNPINFSSLQELALFMVTMRDEKAIENLISGCPSVEYLSLVSCHSEAQWGSGLESIRIHGLNKLKKLEALGIQGIDVDAPKLEDLEYRPIYETEPFKFNVDKCKNLKSLQLSDLHVTSQLLRDLFLEVPLLESLHLCSCDFSQITMLSSAHLKVFEMSKCCLRSTFKKVNIYAPNLRSLRYEAFDKMPILSFMGSLSQLQVDISLTFYFSFLQLKRLRRFLRRFEHGSITLASLSLKTQWQDRKPRLNASLDVSISPPSIKHLNLWIGRHHYGLVRFLTAFLCICHPTTISVISDPISDSMIEGFCKELDSRNYECSYCSIEIKCWWHRLTSVEVIRRTIEEVTIQLEY